MTGRVVAERAAPHGTEAQIVQAILDRRRLTELLELAFLRSQRNGFVLTAIDGRDPVSSSHAAEALGDVSVARMTETLMFLPGASGNRELWRRIGDGLSHPGPRVYWGWPGFGGMPSDPSVRGLSDLVKRVVGTITGPTVLFAQSMGGVIALQTALAVPDKVRGLVLSVTSGGIDLASLGAVDWRPAMTAEDPTFPPWFLDARDDLSSELGRIRIPALLLWGDADPISPVAVGRRLAELLPRSELIVVPGGDHDLAHARAADVLPHIERHLRAG